MKVQKFNPINTEESLGEDMAAGTIIILCIIACIAASTLL